LIYIFSNTGDSTTNLVLDWLRFYKEKFIRINSNDTTSKIDSLILDKYRKLFDKLSEKSINGLVASDQVIKKDVFWFRRPSNQLIKILCQKDIQMEDVIFPKFSNDKTYFNSFNNNYKHYLKTFFHVILDDENTRIGSYHNNSMNKINVLRKAEKIGINVPSYIVTRDLNELEDFFNKNDNDIICKSLFEVVYPIGVNEAGFLLRCLTSQISNLDALPQVFYPSLFQKNIHKEFEIRSFFLEGKWYSSAMFTQGNDKTKIDFRNYDSEKPTRIIPYKLDDELEDKLSQLMNEVDLNSGSIDIIKGIDGEYYFLEINPIGQFGFISEPCNYNLPKIIAESLIKKQNGKV